MMNKKEKKKMKILTCMFWVMLILLFISIVGHAVQDFKATRAYLEGIYSIGGTEAICSLLNNSMTQGGECIIGNSNYNDKSEFKKYRHHFECSWAELNVGATYTYLSYYDKIILKLVKCTHEGITKIEQPYDMYIIK